MKFIEYLLGVVLSIERVLALDREIASEARFARWKRQMFERWEE